MAGLEIQHCYGGGGMAWTPGPLKANYGPNRKRSAVGQEQADKAVDSLVVVGTGTEEQTPGQVTKGSWKETHIPSILSPCKPLRCHWVKA